MDQPHFQFQQPQQPQEQQQHQYPPFQPMQMVHLTQSSLQVVSAHTPQLTPVQSALGIPWSPSPQVSPMQGQAHPPKQHTPQGQPMQPPEGELSPVQQAMGIPPSTVDNESDVVVAVDPLSAKLHIPRSAVRPSHASQRVGIPSLCLLYLEGRCRQGMQCHQLHATPCVVQALRAEALQRPTCCGRHGDSSGDRFKEIPAAQLDGRKLIIQGFSISVAASVAFTEVLPRLLDGSTAKDVLVNVGLVCRLHLATRCRFGAQCKFLHVCRDIVNTHLSAWVKPMYTNLELKMARGGTPSGSTLASPSSSGAVSPSASTPLSPVLSTMPGGAHSTTPHSTEMYPPHQMNMAQLQQQHQQQQQQQQQQLQQQQQQQQQQLQQQQQQQQLQHQQMMMAVPNNNNGHVQFMGTPLTAPGQSPNALNRQLVMISPPLLQPYPTSPAYILPDGTVVFPHYPPAGAAPPGAVSPPGFSFAISPNQQPLHIVQHQQPQFVVCGPGGPNAAPGVPYPVFMAGSGSPARVAQT